MDQSGMDDLRRQLEEQRAARTQEVQRLKQAANKAATGRPTPITDSYKLPPADPMAESAEEDETPTQRIKRCHVKVKEAHEQRRSGLEALKRTSQRAIQFARRTTFMDPAKLEEELDSSGNGNGLKPAASEPLL